jgi:DNA-binding MarR family transcriptional regulator
VPPSDETYSPLTEEHRAIAGGLGRFINAWVKGMEAHGHKSPPFLWMAAFAEVLLEPGLSVSEYAERLHVSKSTMSRALLDIGDRNRKGEPGVGLVTSRPNPLDRRQLEYMLTTKGHALAEQWGLFDEAMRRELDRLCPENQDA